MSESVFAKQCGVTLIEMVVTIVIMAIALFGVTTAISLAISRSSDVLLEARAMALAQSYLDEITAKRFDENSAPRGIPPCRSNCTIAGSFGPDGGETARQDYDDVDDYDGLIEGFDQITPLQDVEGNDRTGYEGFWVDIDVRYLELGSGGAEENLATEANDLTDEEDAKHITITVYHIDNTNGWVFSVYKANF